MLLRSRVAEPCPHSLPAGCLGEQRRGDRLRGWSVPLALCSCRPCLVLPVEIAAARPPLAVQALDLAAQVREELPMGWRLQRRRNGSVPSNGAGHSPLPTTSPPPFLP